MALTIAVLAGITAALLLHWFTWYTRRRHPSVAVGLGLVATSGLILISGIVVLTSFIWPSSGADGAYVVQYVFSILWGFVLLFALPVGYLQARSLAAPWWHGVLSVFYEAGIALLIVASANASRTLQMYGERLGRIRIQNIEYYSFRDAAILIFFGSLAVLGVVRPLIRLLFVRRTLGKLVQ